MKIDGEPKKIVDFFNRMTRKLVLKIGGLKIHKYVNREG